MSVKERFHGALVYFGLAEEAPLTEAHELPAETSRSQRSERGSVRRLPQRANRDEIDEIFADDGSAPRRAAPLRSVAPKSESRVHLVHPHSFNDAQEIGDCFKDGVPVIINLVGAEQELIKRMVDFASGLTYALDGSLQKIADKVFVLTPENVEFSAEERAALVEKGFFNQS
jgi:cell division inhibitor SepF